MWHLFQKNFLFLGFSCCEKAANIFPVGFKRNWPHTWSVVELFTFGHFLLNLESEIFCCLCDGSQSPDANIGCNDVSQSKSHKSFVLVHDHLNISEIGTYGKWIHWNSTEWTSQNSKREDRLRNRLIEVLPCGSWRGRRFEKRWRSCAQWIRACSVVHNTPSNFDFQRPGRFGNHPES